MSNNSAFNSFVDQFRGDISKKRVLLIVDEYADYDTVSALVGFNKILSNLGIGRVDVAFTNPPTGKSKKVLEKSEVSYLTSLKKPEFVIKIKYADTEGAEIDDLKWEVDQDTVSFHVVPLKGKFDLDRVTIEQVGAVYDSTILFNIVSEDQIEDLTTTYKYLFENVKLTILTNRDNVIIGGNVIKNSGEALSELVYRIGSSLLEKTDNKVEEIVGDVLLEGMLSYVEIMQGNHIPVKTFDWINTLVQKGYNVKDAWKSIYLYDDPGYVGIVSKLFENIKVDSDAKIIWSRLSRDDIADTGINEEDFDIGGKIPFNITANYRMAFILYEGGDNNIYGVLEVNDSDIDAVEVLGEYLLKGKSSRASFVVKSDDIFEAERIILDCLSGDSVQGDEENEYIEKVKSKKVKIEDIIAEEIDDNNKSPISPPPIVE